jgi:ribosome assembly protein 4
MLASESWDGTIKIWNTLMGECVKILSDHSGITSLIMMNDNMLASGSEDKTIKIWN